MNVAELARVRAVPRKRPKPGDFGYGDVYSRGADPRSVLRIAVWGGDISF